MVSPQLRQQALDWILAAAQRPDPALEPEFDIADDERREAKKVRNLHRHDPLFWDDWFARSGLDALVRDHLRKPRLLRTRRSSSATPTSPTSRCTRTSRYGRSATKARRPSGSP
ncbi:hypothetical protein P4056_28455 [Pseudomonas aeruginosa]|nr:hypothetical protein [Pseudomonas aeruginosa]